MVGRGAEPVNAFRWWVRKPSPKARNNRAPLSSARSRLAGWTNNNQTSWLGSAAPFHPNTCADPSAVDKPNWLSRWEVILLETWPESKHWMQHPATLSIPSRLQQHYHRRCLNRSYRSCCELFSQCLPSSLHTQPHVLLKPFVFWFQAQLFALRRLSYHTVSFLCWRISVYDEDVWRN